MGFGAHDTRFGIGQLESGQALSVNCLNGHIEWGRVRLKDAREITDRDCESDGSTSRAPPSQAGVSPPTVLGMAASFAGSMAKFAASGFKRVDEESYHLRVGQCEPCSYRRGNRCMLCGCFFAQKAWLPHEDCPIGRWTT